MENSRTNNLILQGQDSVDFYNSLYHPSEDQIKNKTEYISRIANDVSILEQTDDGLIASVRGLDLSFLLETYTEKLVLTVQTKMHPEEKKKLVDTTSQSQSIHKKKNLDMNHIEMDSKWSGYAA